MFLDTPDTLIAQLTLEGRNLLARCKLGDIVYRVCGWQWGRGGYLDNNPVKVSPIVDAGANAFGGIRVISNDWTQGTYFTLNGRRFTYHPEPPHLTVNSYFKAGATIVDTVKNMRDSVLDSTDTRHYRVVLPYIDGATPDTLSFENLIVGDISNQYPIDRYQVAGDNFEIIPMSGGVSASLIDPAWPVGGGILPFSSPHGSIEFFTETDVGFLTRISEGIAGMSAYGEVGIYAEVLASTFEPEVNRRVLFAIAHSPIVVKTDRSISTLRIIIGY